jgi:EmrB/QacA subfamily drug resistance transporter
MTLSRTRPRTAPAGGPGDRLSREILVLSAVVILGTIMTVLDLTIVNVAIPTLVADLHATIDSVQWVLTGYMLAFATVIPLTGWASGRFGARRVWLTALGLFLAGSLLSATAWSIGALIAFRVLQGLGAGLILPVGQTILAQAAGPQRMGRVMSVIGVPLLLAPVFGPVLGGAILGAASWRWIFLLNLPIGAAAIVAAWRLLPQARPRPGQHPAQRLDVRGLVLLCPGIAAALYGLSEAGTHGGFGGLGTAVATLAGLALIGLYIWHAVVAGPAALIDLSLLRRRGFATAAAMNFLLPVALFGSLILIPLYYQVIRHAGPVQIGLLLAPQGVGAALTLPVAGLLTDKIGARAVCSAGLLLALLGTLGYTQLGAHTPEAYLAAALFVTGAGIGSTISPSMAAAFGSVAPAEMPRATSALNTLQRIAGALGTALFAILLQHAITASQAQHPGSVSAVASAFGSTFWVAVALIAATLVPALLLPRPAPAGQAGTGQAVTGQRPAAGDRT